jgi:GNAT superfamily N-acetyltransferase
MVIDKYKPITITKVNVFIEKNDCGDLIIRIDDIRVPKKDRGNGMGRMEVENIIKWAKSNGINEIVLESKRDAIPFWEKMGFDIDDQGSRVSTGILNIK